LDGKTDATNTDIDQAMKMNITAYLVGLVPLTIPDSAMNLALGSLLGDMLGGGGGGIMDDAIEGLNLKDKFLFLGLNGRPAQASDAVAALGIGILPVYDPSAVGKSEDAKLPAGLTVFDTAYRFNKPAKDLTTNGNDIALGVDFAPETLSQILAGILGNSKIEIPGADLPIPLIIIPSGTVTITFNPNGIAFDNRLNRLILNDVRLEHSEGAGKLWQMSLDMTFDIHASSSIKEVTIKVNNEDIKEEHSFLDLSLSLVAPLSHCHIIKDNMGIGLFDHGNFVETLVGVLAKEFDKNATGATINYPLDLTGMAGMQLLKENGLQISTDNEGHCFMKMAMTQLKPSCFIATAEVQ